MVEGKERGVSEWLGRVVVFEYFPGVYWVVSDIKNSGEAVVREVDIDSDGNILQKAGGREYTVLVSRIKSENPYYDVSGDPSKTTDDPETRGEVGGVQVKGGEDGVFSGETRGGNAFISCTTLEEIGRRLRELFPSGNIKTKKEGADSDWQLLNLVYGFFKANDVVPANIFSAITNKEGFRDAILRSIRSDFESPNSFDACNNFDEIIKRIENIVGYNKVFAQLSKFKIKPILLTNSGEQDLLRPYKGERSFFEGGASDGDCYILGLLKNLKLWKGQGYSSFQIKEADDYKLVTSKYGLRMAVDRALGS